MARATDMETGQLISTFVQHDVYQNTTKIINNTLDGRTHIQIIGEPSYTIKATIYVDDAGKAKVEQAEAKGDRIKFESFGVEDIGVITQMTISGRMGRNHWKCEIEAAKLIGDDE